MIKQIIVRFCWGLMLLSMLGLDFESTSAQFKESEMSQGLFQDFEDGYIKV